MNLSIYRTLRTPIREVSDMEFLSLNEFLYLITKLGVFNRCASICCEIHNYLSNCGLQILKILNILPYYMNNAIIIDNNNKKMKKHTYFIIKFLIFSDNNAYSICPITIYRFKDIKYFVILYE
jgi:hypothetical protein